MKARYKQKSQQGKQKTKFNRQYLLSQWTSIYEQVVASDHILNHSK